MVIFKNMHLIKAFFQYDVIKVWLWIIEALKVTFVRGRPSDSNISIKDKTAHVALLLKIIINSEYN